MSTPISTPLTATERLAQSRAQLRTALRQLTPQADRPDRSGSANPNAPGGNAAARVPLQWLHNWWARQPARLALSLAANTANLVLEPVAQRHPYRLVTGAAAVGALMVVVRPWRWSCASAMMAGVMPRLVSEAMSVAVSNLHLTRPIAPKENPT